MSRNAKIYFPDFVGGWVVPDQVHRYFQTFSILMPSFRDVFVRAGLLKPRDVDSQPKTWRERLSFVADNAKDDKDAPSYLFGHLRCYIVFDTDSDAFYNWLKLVSVAVIYNFIFVIGRSCFWEMANLMPIGWLGKETSL